MKRLAFVIVLVSLSLLHVAASAGQVSYEWTNALTDSRVNWSESIALSQYSGSQALTAITISMETSITADIGLENLAYSQSNMSVDLQIDAELKKGGAGLISESYQKAETFTNIGAKDSNLDWGGAAGFEVAGWMTAPATIKVYSVDPVDFAGYVGGGNVMFDVSAMAVRWVPTGSAGSMAAYYKAIVPTTVKVTYSFVPEPGGVLALATGLVGLMGLSLRRRRI